MWISGDRGSSACKGSGVASGLAEEEQGTKVNGRAEEFRKRGGCEGLDSNL